MSTTPISFPFSVSSRNNGLPNRDLQLATSIKEGRCTPADEARLNTLLASLEGNTFFDNPIVQPILLEGVLDGKMTDQRIVDRLKDCAVCLTQDDQIDLIRSRTRVITDLSPEQAEQIGFVLRFFRADQQLTLLYLNAKLKPAHAKQEDEAMMVDSDTNSLSDDPQTMPVDSACNSQQENQRVVAFEEIANRIVGSAMVMWNICDTYWRQGEVLNHEELAQVILDGTENQIERQQFETILASDNARTTFFNDSAVQVMIVEALCDGRSINSDMLHGLRDCIPNLPDSNQRQLVWAIKKGKFGTDPAVLQAVAQNLNIFTDPQAQQTIAWAMRYDRFGTDPAVLQAIARHLSIFTDPAAQQTIAQAISYDKFGTDPAVLQEVAQHLAIFTDPEAQQTIAWAMRYDRFGTDPAVLQAIARHLSIFTDPAAQQTIAQAISNGRFGSDPAVLREVAQHLSIFTDPLAQYFIATANWGNRFGTDPAVRQAATQHLTIFTNPIPDPTAQRVIAEAIRYGQFGTDPAVLQEVAQHLAIFTDPEAQQTIAWAMRYDRFGTDPAVLQAIARHLSIFTDPAAQQTIAQAISNGKFGSDPAVLREVAQHLSIFTDPLAQYFIATANWGNRFGTDPAVRQAATQHLSIFTDPVAQEEIAYAIRYGQFGTDPAVLLVVAQNLTIFTDTEPKKAIAWAIEDGRFDTDPAVLLAIAEHLFIFTDPTAQERIASAIKDGRFDTDPAVLLAIAEHLFIFTDPTAQERIASAIKDGKFGTDPAVRLAVAQNLGIFTAPEAQQKIALAIRDDQFGTDPAVLQTIAQHLAIFTDSVAQRMIAWAIRDDQFGTDPAVLLTIAQHLSIFTYPEAQISLVLTIQSEGFGTDSAVMMAIAQHLSIFTDPEAQYLLAGSIEEGIFGNDPPIFKAIFKSVPQLLDKKAIIRIVSRVTLSAIEKIEALRERKFALDLSATTLDIPEEDLPNLFGAKAYLGSEIKTLLPTYFPDATEDGIDSVCEDNLEYAIQIHHQQLILYPLRSHQDRADFIGWMHPADFTGVLSLDYVNPENSILYKQCVTNIKIYDFGQLQGGYPTLTSGGDLSVAHNLFATLPAYLQQAIRDNSFDINQFRYANVIRFVTETLMKPLVARDAELANKMRAIMQSSIVAQGDYIKIAQTNAEDAAIKDQINALCDTAEIRERSTTAVDRFLASLTPADKRTVLPRLAVLLGTMAKKKVLGYYHGEINQANTLLYLLASHCFHQLQGKPGIVFPENFHSHLGQGVCIESLTNSFVIANGGAFHDVFATH